MNDAAVSIKWEQALARLWRQSRFSSYFYQSVDLFESGSVPTLALCCADSRTVVYYNPAFIDATDTDELLGLMVHEMLHIVHSHDHRSLPHEDVQFKNLTQDMIVNSFIREHEESFFSRMDSREERTPRLVLPDGLAYIPVRFTIETGNRDPRWEDLYRWLKEQPQEKLSDLNVRAVPSGEQGDDTGSLNISDSAHNPDRPAHRDIDGDLAPGSALSNEDGVIFKDYEGNIVPAGMHLFRTERQRTSIEANMERVFSMARLDKNCEGERMFGELEILVRRLRETDNDSWRRLIKSYVDFSSQSDEWYYSYARFNRRYFAGGIYAPGRIFREKQSITVAVDVSGSMVTKPEELEAAFGVIEELLGKYTVHLVFIDENVFVPQREGDEFISSGNSAAPYVYRKGDWKYIHSKKSGTTFFGPLFNNFMRRHKEMLLVITDGYIYDLHKLRKYTPTLWVISASRKERFDPPFGRAVRMRVKKLSFPKP